MSDEHDFELPHFEVPPGLPDFEMDDLPEHDMPDVPDMDDFDLGHHDFVIPGQRFLSPFDNTHSPVVHSNSRTQ